MNTHAHSAPSAHFLPPSGMFPAWNVPPVFEAGRLVVVADLDETLFRGVMQGGVPRFTPRPGAGQLLCALHDAGYQPMVWTAGTAQWAELGLYALWQHGALVTWRGGFERERCSATRDLETGVAYYRKRLDRLNPALERAGLSRRDVLVIDDSQLAWGDRLGNLARVPEFTGAPDDDALYRLADQVYLWAERWRRGEPMNRIHKGVWAPAYQRR